MRRVRRKENFKMASEKGFTLIELLLVMVILAVLAATVSLKFTGRSKEARITAARVDIANIQAAMDSLEVGVGRYPTTSEGLKWLVEEPTGVSGWKGPYIRGSVPKDPWGQEYAYRQPGRHNTSDYDLYSFGPDGVEGGDDDIDNWSDQ